MKKSYYAFLAAGLLITATAVSSQAGVVIQPYASALPSNDTDMLVHFNATNSVCYEVTETARDTDSITYACRGGDFTTDGLQGDCYISGVLSSTQCDHWIHCMQTCDDSDDDGIMDTCTDGTTSCDDNADCRTRVTTQDVITSLTCNYSWDYDKNLIGSGGEITSVSASADVVEYTYYEIAASSYSVELTVTTDAPFAESATTTVLTTPPDIKLPAKSADFSTDVTDATCVSNVCNGGSNDGYTCSDNAECPGGSVTLTFASAPSDLYRAYIYWGDRKRSTVDSPVTNSTAIHTYGREGTFNIQVRTLDLDHYRLIYTSTDDADLSVTP